MRYTVWLFDGTYHVVDESSYAGGIAEVEAAMIERAPVQLGKALVAGSAISRIEPFGNPEEHGAHLEQLGFSSAASLLESGRGASPDAERIKDQIRETLRTVDPAEHHRRAYLAVRRLAVRLHGEGKVAEWRLADWERFNEAHPDPERELEAAG